MLTTHTATQPEQRQVVDDLLAGRRSLSEAVAEPQETAPEPFSAPQSADGWTDTPEAIAGQQAMMSMFGM